MLIPSSIHRLRGGTIIELLIAIAIMAVLIAMASPSIESWTLNSQIRTGAESLLDGLQRARNEAVKRNTHVEFVLNHNGMDIEWTMQIPNPAPTTVVETRPPKEGTDRVKVQAYPVGTNIITFDGKGRRWGQPASGKNFDNTDQMDRICVGSTVLPGAKSRNLEINVKLTGEVRMCDPEVADSADNRYCNGYPTPCKGY